MSGHQEPAVARIYLSMVAAQEVGNTFLAMNPQEGILTVEAETPCRERNRTVEAEKIFHTIPLGRNLLTEEAGTPCRERSLAMMSRIVEVGSSCRHVSRHTALLVENT